MAEGIERETFAHAAKSLEHVTQQKWVAQLVLITHFAAEIMLMAFLSQGCETPSSRFECHLTVDLKECIR